MLKKLLIYSIFVVVVIAINLSCELNNGYNEFKDFAVKDTASILKFKISDTENNIVEISRDNTDKKWLITGTTFEASKPSVELLMETFYRIRVKQDVPNSAFNTVINRLSVKYKKVEIFKDVKKPFKTWYIGSPTQDHLGTYMLLQNGKIKSSVPFITHKPGMYGSLDVRFFTGVENWRSTVIFNYINSKKIHSISVKFKNDSLNNYKIERVKEKVVVYDNAENEVKDFDTIQIKHYLTHFNNINYNKNMFFKAQIRDSILAIVPDYQFELKDYDNKIIKVNLWKVKDNNSDTGWDKEYGIININESNELLRVQYFNWEILFKPLSYFKKDFTK